MSSYQKRTDSNQDAIMSGLRQAGASVYSLAPVGHGVPDLLVGFRGKTYLLEVKGRKGRLTPAQHKFHDEWRGQIAVVRCLEDALLIIGVYNPHSIG